MADNNPQYNESTKNPPENKPDTLKEKAEGASQTAREKVSEAVGQTQDKVSDAASRVREKATDAASQAKEELEGVAEDERERLTKKTKSVVKDRRERITNRIYHVQGAVEAAASQLREDDEESLAGYVDYLADGCQSAAQYLESSTSERFINDVSNRVSSRPILFLGGLFATGLVVSYLVRSSQNRDDDDRDDDDDRVAPPEDDLDPAMSTTTVAEGTTPTAPVY